jgi:serine/threonine protein kinase
MVYRADTLNSLPQELGQEALLWKHLNHPHILPFLGVTYDVFTPRLTLVFPWMPNGNILSYLEKRPHADRLTLVS